MRLKKFMGIAVMVVLLQTLSPNYIKAAMDEDLFLKAKENTFGINEYNLECDVNEDGNIDVFDLIRIKRNMLFDSDNSEDLTFEAVQDDLEVTDTHFNSNETTVSSINGANSELFNVFALKPIDDNKQFANSTSSWWASEYHYEAGYVESIRLNPNSGAVPTIMIVDATDEKVVFKGTAVDNIVEVKQLIEHDFYVFVKGVKYSTMKTQWSRFYEDKNFPDTLDIGSSFVPEFHNCGYIFAVEITYKNVDRDSLVLKKEGTPKMFVAGDSITAGYPYMANRPDYALNEDIRWGRQVARRLGYDIDFGEQNGNGWVHSTGSANAYSITRDTDFKQYDVVIYAWGTNDYRANCELGDVDDNPSEKVTVCSRIKWAAEKIYTDNPEIVFIVSLPLNRNDRGKIGTKETNWAYGTKNQAAVPYTLGEMCDKMAELCEIQGIPYIDNRVSAFNRYSITALTTDGLHPNSKGYKILGTHITGEVARIVSPYYANALTEGNY